MIGPEHIREQAERWWAEVLRASLEGLSYFPKALRGIGKVKVEERLLEFDRIRKEQNRLISHCKTRRGKGFTLHWEERNYRNVGQNRFIQRITIDNLDDYLYLLQRETTYWQFQQDAALILAQLPQLRDWCLNNVLIIEQYHGKWSYLLEVVRYFLYDLSINRYYIRELPLAIPTKFVETHRSVLSSMLDVVLPPNRIDDRYRAPKDFEQRYGLKYRQPTVRLRLLDSVIADTFFNGLDDLQVPLDQFVQLRMPLQRVIILENKTNFSNLMNFLTLPQFPGTAGIFGSGFGLGRLQPVPWLHEVDIFYWGDLDAHGLQILSQLRGYFPHTRAFLMDRTTLDAFSEYALTGAAPSTASALPHLTDEEHQLFDYLNRHQLRLEQERIPLAYVREKLAAVEWND